MESIPLVSRRLADPTPVVAAASLRLRHDDASAQVVVVAFDSPSATLPLGSGLFLLGKIKTGPCM